MVEEKVIEELMIKEISDELCEMERVCHPVIPKVLREGHLSPPKEEVVKPLGALKEELGIGDPLRYEIAKRKYASKVCGYLGVPVEKCEKVFEKLYRRMKEFYEAIPV